MRRLLSTVFIMLALQLSGCANLGYYLQSARGQIDIWTRERDIADIVGDSATPDALRRKLVAVSRIRDFASRELGLPDNMSYRRYADVERKYAVWNVFAAPEFSVKPEAWCFPIVGCVNYRGFFSMKEADRFAAELEGRGYDVYVGGVPAYSTLGWFADPVLNTFVYYPDPVIARLIFHELAHQLLYVRGDTVFNESFAVAVEREGVKRWLARYGSASDAAVYDKMRTHQEGFIRLVQRYRERLESLYTSGLDPQTMRSRKGRVFSDMVGEYGRLKARWGGFSGYDAWFVDRPNNASLASVAIYTKWVPAFQALLRHENGSLPDFYAAVKKLAELSADERRQQLENALLQTARTTQQLDRLRYNFFVSGEERHHEADEQELRRPSADSAGICLLCARCQHPRRAVEQQEPGIVVERPSRRHAVARTDLP